MGCALLLLAGGISYVLAKKLSEKVAILVSEIERIRESDSTEVSSSVFRNDREFSVIADQINSLLKRIVQMKKHQADLAKAEAVAHIASQVSHDIRSPLAALEMVSRDLGQVSEEVRLMIRSAVTRIKDIANDLEPRRRSSPLTQDGAGAAAHEPQLLPALLETLMTEKRLQYRARIGIEMDLRLDTSSYGIFVGVDSVEFKRVVSNLINNAVESLDREGRVLVHVTRMDDEVCITVTDNGCGIPSDVLPILMRRGVTHGKPGGSGLGLHHARTVVESMKGRLTLTSEVGKGASVSILLPRVAAPSWFVPEVDLKGIRTLVVVDDDATIHQIWAGRIEKLGLPIELLHFSRPDQFVSWFE
jgi:signal transduction histidine kinase